MLLLTTYIGSRIWEVNWYQNKWPWPLVRCRFCHVNHRGVNISKFMWAIRVSNLVFVWGMPSGAQIIFPKDGCGLGYVMVKWPLRISTILAWWLKSCFSLMMRIVQKSECPYRSVMGTYRCAIPQRWPRDARYISGSNEPLRRYGHSKLSCRQLGFHVTGNSAIRSADPEKLKTLP